MAPTPGSTEGQPGTAAMQQARKTPSSDWERGLGGSRRGSPQEGVGTNKCSKYPHTGASTLRESSGEAALIDKNDVGGKAM